MDDLSRSCCQNSECPDHMALDPEQRLVVSVVPGKRTDATRESPLFERFPAKFDLAEEFYWQLRGDPYFRIILLRAMAWAMQESFDPFKPLVTLHPQR